jgi:hypothetical protein
MRAARPARPLETTGLLLVTLALAANASELPNAVGLDRSSAKSTLEVWLTPDRPLPAALVGLADGTTVHIAPGDYRLGAHPYVEPTCGNCEEPNTEVSATVGLVISGKGLHIEGEDPEGTVLHTEAGYGLLFEGCEGCVLSGVTVTGGIRDPDGQATDAAIVAKHSTLEITGCIVRDNVGDPALVNDLVVGIIGIAGREGADLWIHDSQILRNSWDGIALYRGASAAIENNVIDGIDRARGSVVGGGRGVGIGLTWNARGFVRGNLVRNYWKGIGLFVDAHGELESNVVESVLTWGISVWDAGRGHPSGWVKGNIVYDTGACGVSIILAEDAPGILAGNVIARTGQDERYDGGEPYCQQIAIARHAVPEAFVIEGNLLFDNREPGDAPGSLDIDETTFREKVAPLVSGLGRWSALERASFVGAFRP